MKTENALKWFLGCYSENGNHRPDQYTYEEFIKAILESIENGVEG